MRITIFVLLIMFGLQSCIVESETEIIAARIDEHYAAEFSNYAEWFELPLYYLKALAAIESSGRKEVPPRFEQHVYENLKQVKSGKSERLENITTANLQAVSDSSLRDMAKSWGAFQIMGYKCFFLHISIDELKTRSEFYGAQWIDFTYGDLLRKGDFKNAFHIHNTGKAYPESGSPLTYDSLYVEKGLQYLRYFKEREANRRKVRIRLH